MTIFFFIEAVDPKYGMMTFMQYVEMRRAEVREGLWLADKNAVAGMSKINPFPATQARLNRMRLKPVKPPKPFTPTVQKVSNAVPTTPSKPR